MASCELSSLSPPDRSELAGPAVEVAPNLLGKILVCREGDRTSAGRIVEVEAYGGADDPASHAYGGLTRRNRSMFGPAGLLYVYFTYGMHHCANVVCGEAGEAQAVLVRALEPIAGLEAMAERRGGTKRPGNLCSGPAKLCQALGIGLHHDGIDLCDPASPAGLLSDGTGPYPSCRGPRVGISRATERPWRWRLVAPAARARSAVDPPPGGQPRKPQIFSPALQEPTPPTL